MRYLTLFILTLKQIKREKFIYCCQILAIAAVLVPILIILGLKHGMISSMKNKLLSYPSTLELKQSEVFEIDEDDIKLIKSWPETQFVAAMPNINGIVIRAMRTPTTERTITIEDHSSSFSCDLKVSADGDPLMKTADCAPPQDGELVVSTRLAKQLKLSVGDSITLSVARNENRELWAESFKIIGILPLWASSRAELYGCQKLVYAIEEYQRSGKGIAGEAATINSNAYQALRLDTSTNQTEGEHLASLLQMSRFELSDNVHGLPDGTPLLQRTGQRFDGTELNYLISIAEQSSRAIKATPWNPPITVQLGGEAFTLHNRAELYHDSAALCEAPPILRVNPNDTLTNNSIITINGEDGQSNIYCEIIKDSNVPLGELWTSPQLVALAHQASRMLISWDYRTGSLRYPRVRSMGLRLYSTGLTETEILYEKMRESKLPCNARLASIQQLLSLEQSLNTIFIIISSFAAFGGSLALGFNIFNAIERHRRDYALLQLLGAGKYSMTFLPLIEALFVTTSAILLALGVFYAASSTITYAFSQYDDASTICILTAGHIIYLFCVGALLAFLAALASTARMLSISPSEIIRES